MIGRKNGTWGELSKSIQIFLCSTRRWTSGASITAVAFDIIDLSYSLYGCRPTRRRHNHHERCKLYAESSASGECGTVKTSFPSLSLAYARVARSLPAPSIRQPPIPSLTNSILDRCLHHWSISPGVVTHIFFWLRILAR